MAYRLSPRLRFGYDALLSAHESEGKALEKKDFQQDTRYTVTMRDAEGKLRPANIYIYRLYDEFMILRYINGDGLLRKVKYDAIAKIVKTIPVREEDRFYIPEAVLAEGAWKDRDSMFRYSSSPHMGK